MMHYGKNIVLGLLATTLLCSCKVGPDYVKPATEKPTAYKEAQLLRPAQPGDDAIRGRWWELFNDPGLNRLEEQVAINNQNVKAAEAQFRQARALVAVARSGYFPTVGANVSATRSGAGGHSGSTITTGGGTGNSYNAELDASWEPDLWGRIRRTVEANEATAQASAADLASAQLSAQGQLAIDYMGLRIADQQKRTLDETVTNYQRSYTLTQNQYNVGVAAKSDVMQAQVQLESAQAQAIDVGVARAQFEHAIAMLIGKAPADFSITPTFTVPTVPDIPIGVPSQLLERRPDIAAAERSVAAANAQIGVTKAAFYPDITLSAAGGFAASAFGNWFSLPGRFWSIGPSLVETLFDAGLRSAQTEAAIAAYDQTVANYRQTVLGAFQEVEDNLASLRIYAQEDVVQRKAVDDAHISTTIAINQYKAGIVTYVNVVTAQNAELSNTLAALTVERNRLTAAATLIMDLGGGWDAKALDKPEVVTPKTTPLSILPPSK